MKTKWLAAIIALIASAIPALAQTPPGTITSSGVAGAYNSVAKTCTDGFFCYVQTDVNGQLKVTGSFSSSTTGFPTVQTTGTPISVTTGGVTGTLPSGTVVVASNVGTTNMAFCKLGASSSTSDIPLAPNGGWFAFTVGANTQLTCITSTSTTTVNMAGGSGLATGTGGGGGSSGGSVTQGTSPWVTSVTTWGAGTLGAMANYGTSPGAILVPGVNAFVTNTNANGQATMANSSPIVIASNQTAVPTTPSPYPATAVPYTATATGTTAATTATLAGAASVTTYICGFSIRANATAAATGNATVTGTITATLNFTQWTAPNASGLGVTEMIFSPCVPASGTNQSVAVVSAAPGTGGVVSVTAWGYKL